MHNTSVIVTRSKSCHVKTLHTMLRFNVLCLERGHSHEISYVDDDAHKKADVITKVLKSGSDKIFYVEFGVHLDDESMRQIFEKNQCLVFPAAKEGINWDMFKEKVLADSKEPLAQAGLEFDTEINPGQKIADGIYKVKTTAPKVWCMDIKAGYKCLHQKKGQGITVPPKMSDFFEKLVSKDLKIYAYTKARVTVSYAHECLSNILQAAGVKVN